MINFALIWAYLTWVVVDYEDIPSALNNRHKRKNRKHLNAVLCQQSSMQPHLKTHHRKDQQTLLDEDGNVTQTANKAMYCLDARQYADEEEMIDDIYVQINADLDNDEKPRPFPPGIVKSKVNVFVVGGWQPTLDYIAEHAEEWGE